MLFAALVAANLLDAWTTRRALAAFPLRAYESNRLFGRHPSTARLLAVKALMLGVIAWLMLPWWSTPLPTAGVLIGVGVVAATLWIAWKNSCLRTDN